MNIDFLSTFLLRFPLHIFLTAHFTPKLSIVNNKNFTFTFLMVLKCGNFTLCSRKIAASHSSFVFPYVLAVQHLLGLPLVACSTALVSHVTGLVFALWMARGADFCARWYLGMMEKCQNIE